MNNLSQPKRHEITKDFTLALGRNNFTNFPIKTRETDEEGIEIWL